LAANNRDSEGKKWDYHSNIEEILRLENEVQELKKQIKMKSVRLGRFFCMLELQRYSVHYIITLIIEDALVTWNP